MLKTGSENLAIFHKEEKHENSNLRRHIDKRQNSRFKTVASVEAADAIIKGSVVNINTSPLSYNANTLVAEERATVIVEINFREKESGKTIWSSKNATGSVDYKMANDINMFPAARKQALIRMSNDMAEKAFNMMMAGF